MSQQELLISESIAVLSKLYPTSYPDRIDYHHAYFKKKMGDEKYHTLKNQNTTYINKVVKKKEVTFEICNLGYMVLANAQKSFNVIQLSPKIFEERLEYITGYAKEQKYMSKHVVTQNDYIKWVVAHEYAHLKYVHLGHTNEFFSKVEEMYLSLA